MRTRIIVLFAVALSSTLGIARAASETDRACPAGAVPFDEADGQTPPRLVQQVKPVYPESAREAKTSGVVVLDVVIDRDGRVPWVVIVEDPDPALSQAAVDAVRQWRFEPARDADDDPIAVCFLLKIAFRLE